MTRAPVLYAINVGRATAVGAAVLDRPETVAIEWPDVPAGPESGDGPTGIVIGAGSHDPIALGGDAIAAGLPILFEPIGGCGATALSELAGAAAEAGIPAIAAFRRRHEPALAIMAERVASGAIGLPFAVHAEVLASCAPDAATEMLDLLDALCGAVALAPQRLDPSAAAGDRLDGPDILSAILERDASALIGVRLRERAGGTEPGARVDELATIRLMGSHGTVTADLDAPALEVTSDLDRRTDRHERIHARAAELLVDRFVASLGGSGTGQLVSIERAAVLAASPGWGPEAGSATR